jgi:hypothetical protein
LLDWLAWYFYMSNDFLNCEKICNDILRCNCIGFLIIKLKIKILILQERYEEAKLYVLNNLFSYPMELDLRGWERIIAIELLKSKKGT